MDAKAFDRIEKKYLITARQKKQLLNIIRPNIVKDDYFKSRIFNIYFDNKNYDMIINSIDWVDFKAKIRARHYQGFDRVYLELKTKVQGEEDNIGFKRRIKISLADYRAFSHRKLTLFELLSKRDADARSLQIAKEIDYLITYLDLTPKILVTYERESYRDKNQLRVTFDKDLSYRCQNLSFISRKNDTMYFKDERNIIMEVKTQGAVPTWLSQAMSACDVYPKRFSKIGNVYQQIIQKGKHV